MMSVKWRNIGSILTGCILMILASASAVWIVVGIKMLQHITYIDVYYVNILNILLPAGTVVGAIIFGIAAELVGRKITLLLIAVPYAVAFIIFQFARSITLACIGRVIAGLAVGGSYTVLPIYIGEIADPATRGLLASMMTVSSLIGVLIFYVIVAYTTYTVYNIVAEVLVATFFIAFIFLGVESPYYYGRSRHMQNQNKLEKIPNVQNYRDELMYRQEKKSTATNSSMHLLYIQNVKFMRCFGSIAWIKSLAIMSLLIILHHLSGVTMMPMLLFYITSYLGERDINIHYSTILLSSVGMELLGSILSTLLVDRLGRKPCLIISTICIAIFYLPIAIFAAIREKHLEVDPSPALTILFVVMFLIFFYIGMASVPQILLGELFPLKVKMIAAAYLVSVQQVTFFVVTNYFQEISSFIGYTAILFIFMISMWIAPILIYYGVLETKGKTLQEIQIILTNK